MALQKKNTFQKSGTCRKNLEVRQDYNLSLIIFHGVIWSGLNERVSDDSRSFMSRLCYYSDVAPQSR